jgi:signal transduction histidine kinase
VADTTFADLRALTEAGLSLTSELSLDAVLQKVVDMARRQAGARYAALSVLGEDGEIERFVCSGMSRAQQARIAHIPKGDGLLGVLLREGVPLRIDAVAADPRSAGFPPHHPPMRSLLGVPIVSGQRIIGNLYLTEKTGTGSFDERDEEIVNLLATQAAVAIRNAKLYEAEQRRAEEWKALFELGRAVKASPDLQELLDSVVSQARRLVNTDIAVLLLLDSDGHMLRMAAHQGLRTPAMKKMLLTSDYGLQGLALQTNQPVIVFDYQADERLKHRPAALVAGEKLISQIAVPLRGKERPLGTLTVGNRKPTRFTDRQAELLEALGNWAAVAIETSRLYEKLESLARLEERERIGMDLHDGVIQSIYAVGLHLEDCLERLDECTGDVKPRLEKAMYDLNNVIRDIRNYIFDLRPGVSQVPNLPEAIHHLVDDVRVNTLMDVSMRVEGSLEGLLDESSALSFFHIAQEALNNVSRHSKATSVSVILSAGPGGVRLEVRDNGVGMPNGQPEGHEKQGLRNMRDRARSMGADLVIESAPERGTTVRVELPATRGEREHG